MGRYRALVEYDDAAAACGLVIPDVPGCNAMGATFDEVEANGIEALRERAVDHLAEADELPRSRDVVELRQDSSLVDDFTANTIVVSLPVYLDGGRPSTTPFGL